MAEDILSPRSSYGRTFIIAMWTLGIIAAGQVIAVSWAVLTQKPRQPVAYQPPAPVQPQPGPTAQNPAIPPNSGGNFENPAIAGTNPNATQPETVPFVPPQGGILPGPAFEPPAGLNYFPNQKPLGSALESTALETHPAHKIDDEVVAQMVSTGEDLRGTGNTQGALKALREAEEKLPNHPRILAELAGTFSLMGLEEKALDYWEQIYRLGEANAGGYYALADMALKGNTASAAGTTSAVLKIVDAKVIKEEPSEETGQKATLTVSVKGNSKVRPTGAEMEMTVYFYDKVDGKLIETSTADTSQEFPTAPYDWQGGSIEAVDVFYHQPVFTVEQKRDLGTRTFYGFVIELYYREKLQDTMAEPKELLELRAAPLPREELPIGSDESSIPAGTNP